MEVLANIWELTKIIGIAIIGITCICAAVAVFGGLLEKIEKTEET